MVMGGEDRRGTGTYLCSETLLDPSNQGMHAPCSVSEFRLEVRCNGFPAKPQVPFHVLTVPRVNEMWRIRSSRR